MVALIYCVTLDGLDPATPRTLPRAWYAPTPVRVSGFITYNYVH